MSTIPQVLSVKRKLSLYIQKQPWHMILHLSPRTKVIVIRAPYEIRLTSTRQAHNALPGFDLAAHVAGGGGGAGVLYTVPQ